MLLCPRSYADDAVDAVPQARLCTAAHWQPREIAFVSSAFCDQPVRWRHKRPRRTVQRPLVSLTTQIGRSAVPVAGLDAPMRAATRPSARTSHTSAACRPFAAHDDLHRDLGLCRDTTMTVFRL